MQQIIDRLAPAFEYIRLSPGDWPVEVGVAMPGAAALARWPDWPAAATAARGRVGNGRGADAAESRRRAVGEMIETASCCAWGDEPVFEAPQAELAGQAWAPAELTGFADWQRRDRDGWNARLEGVDWIPPATPPGAAIGWMRARRLDREAEVWVPADCVLIGRCEAGDPRACAVADSNGCAAGRSADEALLGALYELIERDATGRWWYGRAPCRAIDPAGLELGGAVERNLAARGRRLRVFDITSDIAVPTVAALGTDPTGRHAAIGVATRAEPEGAALSALAELMQMELRVAAVLMQGGADPDAEPEPDFATVDPAAAPPSEAARAGSGLPACLDALDRAGCRVAAVDLTRPCFGVPVCRALSPDLCHWKPRFGRPRLSEHLRADPGGAEFARLMRDHRLLRI